jgi:DNA modification methylase
MEENPRRSGTRLAPEQFRNRVIGLRWVRAGDLKKNPKNWRDHPEQQRQAVSWSYKRIGNYDRLLVRELADGRLELLDGHLRQDLAPDSVVPVLVISVTDEEADLILATHDPLVGMAEANPERLEALFATLRPGSEVIDQILKDTAGKEIWQRLHPSEVQEIDVSPDLAEQLQAKWNTKFGQLHRAGPHRIICGDSIDETTVARLFEDVSPRSFRVLPTDPPWGVSYNDKNRFLNARDRGNRVQRPILNDQDPIQAPVIFSAALRIATRYAEKGASCYAAIPSGPQLPDFLAGFNQSGFTFKSLLVWVKNQFVLGRSDYMGRHEVIAYGWRDDARHFFISDRTQSTVFEFDKPHASASHPTSKPTALYAKMISNSSRPGELVYDPFAGSGTTLVAAHQLGRIAYGCELDPCYLAVILERLSVLGLTPELVK